MDILKEQIKRSKELMGIINEFSEPLYEAMDATNIDLEGAADAFEEGGDEEMDNWDALDDNMKDTLRQHAEFKGMDEEAIREKFNSMDKTSICKILRFMFGWIVKLFRAPASAFTKSIRRGPMADSSYGRFKAWNCR